MEGGKESFKSVFRQIGASKNLPVSYIIMDDTRYYDNPLGASEGIVFIIWISYN